MPDAIPRARIHYEEDEVPVLRALHSRMGDRQ